MLNTNISVLKTFPNIANNFILRVCKFLEKVANILSPINKMHLNYTVYVNLMQAITFCVVKNWNSCSQKYKEREKYLKTSYRKDTEHLYHAFVYSIVILLSGIYPFYAMLSLLVTIICYPYIWDFLF